MEAVVADKATGPLRKIREELAAFRETDGMKSLKETMAGLREHTAEFSKAAAGASSVMGGIGIVGVAASLSVGKLIDTFRELAARSADLKALSLETGQTVDAINKLEHVAPRFAIAPEAMAKALGTLGGNMEQFRRHVGELYGELSRQAPDVAKKLLGENPDQQVQEIIKFLDTIKNSEIRKNWAEAFFGDGDIARLVQDGYGKFAEQQAAVAKNIPKITADYQKQAEAFNNSIHDFNDALENLETKVGPAIFKQLKQAADDFRSAFDSIKDAWSWWQSNKDKDVKTFVDDNARAGYDALKKQHEANDEATRQGRGPVIDLPGIITGQTHPTDADVDTHRKFQEDRNNINPLFHKSSFATWDDGGGAVGSSGSDGLQRAVRYGVVQGLQDFEDMKRAQQDGAGGAAGGGFQRASYETSGLPSSMGGGGAEDVYSALKGNAAVKDRMDFIRSEAAKLGIDPDVALAVANSEGLKRFSGDNGSSFGDFQLHVGGGLGDAFRKQTGLDPSDPKNWRQMDQFALRHASRNGWTDFHGAANSGIGRMQGIGAGGAAPAGAPGTAVDHAMKLIGAGVGQAAHALGSRMTPGEWCADFINGAFKSAGMQGVNSSMALAFKSWGHAVGLNDAKKGDVLLEDHGGGHGHAMLFTGERDKRGRLGVVSGNYGDHVRFNWEDPRLVSAARRANILDAERKHGGPGDSSQTVTHKGSAEVTIKGLPSGSSIHSKTNGLISSVKLNRASTQPDLTWGA